MDLKDSSIRNQSASNDTSPKLLIRNIKIEIHKLILSQEICDAPDSRAPFFPRDRIGHLRRVQDKTDRRRMAMERILS